MARAHTPRRQSARWLDGDCPSDVLALLDNGSRTFDRWTVLYRHVYTSGRYPYVFGRDMSDHPCHPQGVGLTLELELFEAAALRYRTRSARWSDLPPDVQDCIRRDCRPGGLGSAISEAQAAAMGQQASLPGLA